MDCSALGFPVLHYLPGLAQTRVHWVGDTIQPSYPVSPPSPPALNFSQHQGFFFFSNESAVCISFFGDAVSASVLPMNIQGWFLFELTGLISLQSKGLLKVFSSTINLKASILWHSALDSKSFNIRNIGAWFCRVFLQLFLLMENYFLVYIYDFIVFIYLFSWFLERF